jgi:hypothetical protein
MPCHDALALLVCAKCRLCWSCLLSMACWLRICWIWHMHPSHTLPHLQGAGRFLGVYLTIMIVSKLPARHVLRTPSRCEQNFPFSYIYCTTVGVLLFQQDMYCTWNGKCDTMPIEKTRRSSVLSRGDSVLWVALCQQEVLLQEWKCLPVQLLVPDFHRSC